MTDLRELQSLVDDNMQESAGLIKPDGRSRAVVAAIDRMSKDKARIITYNITATGDYEYSLPTTVGSEWIENFSHIISVEYPADEQDPIYMDPNDYFIYDNGTIQKLRFPNSEPSTGETIRIKFTTKWRCDETASNIEDTEAYPLSCLATSICLRMLAAYFLQTSKASLDIDVIDYNRKSIEATMVADSMENIYRDHIGIPRVGARVQGGGTGAVTACSVEKDLDISFQYGEDFITHPRRYR